MSRGILFVLICSVIAAAIGCYLPGLQGGFLFDDVINIQNNLYIQLDHLDWKSLYQAAMSGSAGMLHRPISMLTFALDDYWGGANPYHFKVVNLTIHLFIGICLFVLTGLLLDLYRRLHRPQLNERCLQVVSLAVAAFWLLHPFNLTAVLYVVQRMASLSALFTFAGMTLYLFGRKRQIAQETGGWLAILVAVFVFTPLAALSKENGLLLPVFLLVVEVTVLQWRVPCSQTRRNLMMLFAVTVILPILLGVTYGLMHPEFITGGYRIRDFSLCERLMTEARVLWFYLHMTVLPSIAAMGFYHDDFVISRGFFTPPTTMMALIGLLVVLVGAWLLRRKFPLIAFGILFFLVGHSMESSIIALELVHEHRNYLPMFGILLPVVYYGLSPEIHPASLRVRKIGAVLVVVLFAMLTWLRSGQWSHPLEMLQMEVQHHPQSLRANADLAVQYAYLPAASALEADLNYRNALEYFTQAAYLSDTDTVGFFGILALNSEHGLPTDSTWTDELVKRLAFSPSSPSSINSLMALEKCHVAGRCTHSPELMERLLRAALRNPTLTGPRRSTALFALSDFLLEKRHQPRLAMEAAYQAVTAAPEDISQRLTLIAFLINMGELDKAKNEILTIRNMNSSGTYTVALEQVAERLTEVKAQSSLMQNEH